MTKVLVTGGAGFIGSWTVDTLIECGYEVIILDNLQERVHPNGKPDWINPKAKFILGDVTNRNWLARALDGVEYVFHLAAYQDYLPDFSNFIHTNTESTALLFELIVSDPKRFPVKKIIFASSQAVSGEGSYYCSHDDYNFIPESRTIKQLSRGDWEIRCPCGRVAENTYISENIVSPGTTYAISKYAIELLADKLGHRYNIPTVCMRYTYVQGPRNSFYNAYSGVTRRFALQIMDEIAPTVYEDGLQKRDYVNVWDVAQANLLVMEKDEANFRVFNVGGGVEITVLELANLMLKEFNSNLKPDITGLFRIGDTRHTISDTSALRSLGWKPKISIKDSVREYCHWIYKFKNTKDYLEQADKIMHEQGVIRKVTNG